jgi:hypothetical protein
MNERTWGRSMFAASDDMGHKVQRVPFPARTAPQPLASRRLESPAPFPAITPADAEPSHPPRNLNQER